MIWAVECGVILTGCLVDEGKGVPGAEDSLSKSTVTSSWRRNSRNDVCLLCLPRPGFNLAANPKAKWGLALNGGMTLS